MSNYFRIGKAGKHQRRMSVDNSALIRRSGGYRNGWKASNTFHRSLLAGFDWQDWQGVAPKWLSFGCVVPGPLFKTIFAEMCYMLLCIPIVVAWETDIVSFGAQICQLASFVHPLWHPGEHGVIQGHLRVHQRTHWCPDVAF